jgi:hypothetical protein
MLASRLARRHISTVGSAAPTVAVLYQAIDPPIINGVQKPRKPGGKLSYPHSTDCHPMHRAYLT